jgi:uncharacterized protein (DUF427 family)
MSSRGRVRTEQGAKRVRAVFGGEYVADTTRPLLVWESPHYPAYYFPREDVRTELIEFGDDPKHSPSRGDAKVGTLRVGDREATGAVLEYTESPIDELRGHIRLHWDAMDAWFEEDEEVFTHPRDPHTRIDILASSRYVRVELDGVTVAESRSPRVLFETGLPPRYYLPKTDVRLGLLRPTDTVTHCPYKGQAEYWSVGEHTDVAWSYRMPLPESQKIAGLVAFPQEKAAIYVDGELLQP